MRKIGLISDTHGLFDSVLQEFLADVDEVWHAGDFGSEECYKKIASFKPLVAVYGNVDGGNLRHWMPSSQNFVCEGCRVLMTHVGGYPNHYDSRIVDAIRLARPNIFIAGHSHILRVMFDRRFDMLYLNPGAAGIYGFHQVRTALRFEIEGGEARKMELGEWPKRSFE
ncbi:MAG: metallophosphoesterase family protein [Rikenellaceae bacterium]|nr:metallophosphoesterase family protein [Rikenellaceae bacterium]